MGSPYVGEIRLFAGNFAPAGWMLCQGQQLPISEYDTLFQLIGTTYGGDGETYFQLPNLAGRVPVHQGTLSGTGSTYQIGESAGVESVTLSTNQIPQHRHGFNVVAGLPGNQVSPSGNLPAMSLNVTPYVNEGPAGGGFNANAITPAGGSQPHENMQPYLGLNFIISLFGIFPSQT